jgi:hypothetical protein
MFERHTEKARRVISFARYEASQYRSHYLDTELLLLGLMRADFPLKSSMIGSGISSGTVRQFGVKPHVIDEHLLRKRGGGIGVASPDSADC